MGVKVDWAYAPGEVKILTSSDGANFEEAKCWQSSTRPEAAYEESFMFDSPRNIKAVSIAMQAPQSWGYFGINSVSLIAEPGPLMLVRKPARWSGVLFGSQLFPWNSSGITSSAGEQCLVAGQLGLGLEPCLEAIAAGDGREVMQFDEEGLACDCRFLAFSIWIHDAVCRRCWYSVVGVVVFATRRDKL